MDPLIYKLLHLTGVIVLFTALGGIIAGACDSCKKKAAILHGVALFLILLGGFGMLAKLYNNEFSGWVIAKIVIWVLLGASLPLAKRQLLPKGALMGLVILLGIVSAYLGIFKPF